MILDDKLQEKPNIDYPCEWGYKLIGRDKIKLQECIKEIMCDKKHSTKEGNISKNGKFVSYNARCIVESENDRNHIFKSFESHKDIDMVI